MHEKITVEALINGTAKKAWACFNEPEHVMQWNHASDDWHSPRAENNLRPGGTFTYRMEAKDGSEGFDFAGTYDEVVPNESLAYTMSDGRTVSVTFKEEDGSVRVVTKFDAEHENPLETQRAGWQAILENFKKHVESE